MSSKFTMFCSKTISKQKIQHNDKKKKCKEGGISKNVSNTRDCLFGGVNLSSGEGMQKKKGIYLGC